MLLLVLSFTAIASSYTATAQPPAAPSHASAAAVPPQGLTADQARTALDVLNDPSKRAAFAATLEAIVKAHPLTGAAATPPDAPAPEPAKQATETTIQGVPLPLMPDSLGAQVLVTASDFLSRAGTRAMDGVRTARSIPLLWGWVVVMATNPLARDLLIDAAWRLAVVLACALAVEFALRRAMRGPISRLEAQAPGKERHNKPGSALLDEPGSALFDEPDAALLDEPDPVTTGEAVQPNGSDDAVARAEAGDIEPPVPPRRGLGLDPAARRPPGARAAGCWT